MVSNVNFNGIKIDAENKGDVQSLSRSADILLALSDGTERLSDICRRTGLRVGTAHRLLKALVSSGLVGQNPVTRSYFLGPFFVKLTFNNPNTHQILIYAAHDQMTFLRELTGESVVVVIPFGAELLNLLELPSKQSISFALGTGYTAPICASCAGKMLLAELPDRELNLLLDSTQFKKLTNNTITERQDLMNEIEKARSQGYATSFAETTPGAAGLAVPIKNYAVPVALGVYGPETRFNRITENLPEIKNSAALISQKLQELGDMSRGDHNFPVSEKRTKRRKTK